MLGVGGCFCMSLVGLSGGVRVENNDGGDVSENAKRSKFSHYCDTTNATNNKHN